MYTTTWPVHKILVLIASESSKGSEPTQGMGVDEDSDQNLDL